LEKKQLRAVFIDRDGTINKMVYSQDHGVMDSPLLPAQAQLMPDAAKALKLLKKKGFLLVLISNQPGMAKGKMTLNTFGAIERRIDALLAKEGVAFDDKYYCFHHPEASVEKYRKVCACRKPKPGMIKQAAAELGASLRDSFVVGDGIVDVKAGIAAGCRTVFVGEFKSELWASFAGGKKPDIIAKNLLAAAIKIR